MSLIGRYIREFGADTECIFVFPSDIASSLWFRTALELTGQGTLPAERFQAWDRFRDSLLSGRLSGRTAIPPALRSMFAWNLAEQNSQNPFLGIIIPAEHAAQANAFSGWLADTVLPQLHSWVRRTAEKPADDEQADYRNLYIRYRNFLDESGFFDPSWADPVLPEDNKKWIIFYPEAIEDWSEYRQLLSGDPRITILSVPETDASPVLYRYQNARTEFRTVVQLIENDLVAGMEPVDIAVSVPDIETAAPYLQREFRLRGIPFEYRSGYPLSRFQAGKLFPLIAACVSDRFSFTSMRALLLDRLIPWKEPARARGLIDFGIRNHCVTSWKEPDGSEVDVWEAAFRTPSQDFPPDRSLESWYTTLKRHLLALNGASDFTHIMAHYMKFRSIFLDMSLLDETDNDVLARCIRELQQLADLERRYPDCRISKPFPFLISWLDTTQYVPQRQPGGVSIFPWRVAAGTPFKRHYVLDASQEDATILYKHLHFLRSDQRAELDAADEDASAAFFRLYSCEPGNDSGAVTRFSCSDHCFGGWRMPHGYFRTQEIPDTAQHPADPWVIEALWLTGRGPAPDRLYPVQQAALLSTHSNTDPATRYVYAPLDLQNPSIQDILDTRYTDKGLLRVSQSDLACFYTCPSFWFLARVLDLKDEESDAVLFNDRNLGLVWHAVLARLYLQIAQKDRYFRAEHLNDYRAMAEQMCRQASAEEAEFAGPLAAPILDSIADRLRSGVERILELDARYLDGWAPVGTELRLSTMFDGMEFVGAIDRLSKNEASGDLTIIDYKSSIKIKASHYDSDGQSGLSDFQMTMYTYLAEKAKDSPCAGKKIDNALFYDIKAGKQLPVVLDPEQLDPGKAKYFTREQFEPAMTEFLTRAVQFRDAVRSGDFTTTEEIVASECRTCDYRTICRTAYRSS